MPERGGPGRSSAPAWSFFELRADEAELAVIEAVDAHLPAAWWTPDRGGARRDRARAGRAISRAPRGRWSPMSLLDAPIREQASAVATGDADPAELLEAALARIEERNPAVNAIVDTFPDESRRMLAEAPRGPLFGVPVAIKDEWPLPWRAERLGAARVRRTAAGGRRVGALPGAPRRRGGDRRGREHARVRRRQHRPCLGVRPGPQPLGHRPLPRRIVERPGRCGRRPAGQRGGGCRRGRVDPLPGRLLRADRAEADLRTRDDGGPPRPPDDDDRLRAALPRRRRLPAAGRRLVRRGARQPRDTDGLRIGVVSGRALG